MKAAFTIIFIFYSIYIFSNNYNLIDSTYNKVPENTSMSYKEKPLALDIIKRAAVPVTLMTAGCLISSSTFEKDFQQSVRDRVGHDYEFVIDDYTQLVPIAQMYAANLMGMEGRNNWQTQTAYMAGSSLLSCTVSQIIKMTLNKPRPNGANHSFPSGHTTLAFTTATVLFQEYKNSSPLYACSGFLFAATTGAFRVINNRHWMSDVLMGAGLGVGLTSLVYYIDPLKDVKFLHKKRNLVVLPQFGDKNYGLGLSYVF